MRILLLCLPILFVACRRPSTQLSALFSPTYEPSDYSRLLKADYDLIAIGNDPGWTMTINPATKQLTFRPANGDSVLVQTPERQNDSDGTFRYNTLTDGGRITALFRPDSCVDRLSGQRYDYRVEVGLNGKNYIGCGVSLQKIRQLQGTWLLTRLNDKPVALDSSSKETPRLEIDIRNGRVTGNTGCNRLSSSFKADTHTLLLGQTITTRMACIGEAGSVEAPFVAALTGPLGYQVTDTTLTMLKAGKPVLVFTRQK